MEYAFPEPYPTFLPVLFEKHQIGIITCDQEQWIFSRRIQHEGISDFSADKQTTLSGRNEMKLMLLISQQAGAVAGIKATGLGFEAIKITGKKNIFPSISIQVIYNGSKNRRQLRLCWKRLHRKMTLAVIQKYSSAGFLYR